MKILPLSDIHGKYDILDYVLDNFDTNDYDVVLVTGDVWEGTSTKGSYKFSNFQQSIQKQIIMIQGNHDFWTNSAFDYNSDIHLLYNEPIEIDGVKFFGTPNTVNFGMWNHMRSESELYKIWDKGIPKGLDVLLSHGPPHGYGDNCNQPIYFNNANSHLGSKSLYKIIMEKEPKYVFCGHIHTGDRHTIMPNGTKCYNMSCLDETYKFLGYNPPPEIIELEL